MSTTTVVIISGMIGIIAGLVGLFYYLKRDKDKSDLRVNAYMQSDEYKNIKEVYHGEETARRNQQIVKPFAEFDERRERARENASILSTGDSRVETDSIGTAENNADLSGTGSIEQREDISAQSSDNIDQNRGKRGRPRKTVVIDEQQPQQPDESTSGSV